MQGSRWIAVLSALALAMPASATIVQYRFGGTVLGVDPGGDSNGVVAGDHAMARVRYDPSLLVDVTAAANAFYGTGYAKLLSAPLLGGGAGLTVDVGPLHFTEADQIGPDPFLGPGAHVLFTDAGFFGVAFFGAKPWLAAFDTAGAAPEPFDFVGGSLKLGRPSYFGVFDYAGARFDGVVPEPASWALLIAGFGLTGAAMRRRRAEPLGTR